LMLDDGADGTVHSFLLFFSALTLLPLGEMIFSNVFH